MLNPDFEKRMLELKNVSFCRNGYSIVENIDIDLSKGETLVISGPSGGGKTTLLYLMSGILKPTKGIVRLNTKRITLVKQQDQFLYVSGSGSMHYSQRYEMTDTSALISVRTYLESINEKYNKSSQDELENIASQLGIKGIFDRKLLQLSNGERKRIQLAAALLKNPELLLMDQPFTGLDKQSRLSLLKILELLKKRMTIIIVCGKGQIPEWVDKILMLDKGKAQLFYNTEEAKEVFKHPEGLELSALKELNIPSERQRFKTIVSMKDVNVNLGGKHILKNINWHVANNERWALSGPNGAGKTTLLSLITADNPQGYNNDLTLFDTKRGSGESIWEIKEKIGFVSPELHLYFLRGKGAVSMVPGIAMDEEHHYSTLTCLDVLISGFNDEIGTVSTPSEYQLHLALHWLKVLKLERLQKSLFIHASLGEQRVLLLGRALVKFPSLLILDEPMQGLDADQVDYFKEMLNQICMQLNTTMIYVSHYRKEIPECVEHFITIDNGEVISIEKGITTGV